MLSPGRRPARVAAGLCPDVYVRWLRVLRCRNGRLEWLVEMETVVKIQKACQCRKNVE
jgi:hypothetical protein